MRERSTKPIFFLFMLMIAIALSGLSIEAYRRGTSSIVGSAVGFVAMPVQSFISYSTEKVRSLSVYFEDTKKLKEENEKLKAENTSLKNENKSIQSVKDENEWLYEFMDLKKQRTNLSFVNSRIITKEAGILSAFTLDKGSFHGVKNNSAIVSDKGIVGMIIETGINYSRAISILNQNSEVGVYIRRTGVPAVLSGDFELYSKGRCKIINLPTDTDILPGDEIYTSGFGSIYPADFMVGTVEEIFTDPYNYTLYATIVPSADLNNTDRVMIVKESQITYK